MLDFLFLDRLETVFLEADLPPVIVNQTVNGKMWRLLTDWYDRGSCCVKVDMGDFLRLRGV